MSKAGVGIALVVLVVGGAGYAAARVMPLAVENEPTLDIYTAESGATSKQTDRLYQQCKARRVFTELACREKVVLLAAYNARVSNPYLPPHGAYGKTPTNVGEAMDEQQKVQDGEKPTNWHGN